MKKIIALAVASAFIAPAFAADVTVSGDVEYMYVDKMLGLLLTLATKISS